MTKFWAAAWQNQQTHLCAKRRLKSAWAATHSDQSLRCLCDVWWNLGSLATYGVHSQEDWSECADSQADPSLCWAHMSFVGYVMLWLKGNVFFDLKSWTSILLLYIYMF